MLLITGRVGITPAQSLYNDLYFKHKLGRRPNLKRVHFVWSVRDKTTTAQGLQEAEHAASVFSDSFSGSSLTSEEMTSDAHSAHDLTSVMAKKGVGESFVKNNSCGGFGMQEDVVMPVAFQPALSRLESVEITTPSESVTPEELGRAISKVNTNEMTFSPLGDFNPSYDGVELRSTVNVLPNIVQSTTVAPSGAAGSPQAEFITDFYLTQSKQSAESAGLGVRLNQRPDIPGIFSNTREYCIAKGLSRVAVIVCGPPSMVSDVHANCRASHASSASKVHFDVHVEQFEI